MKVVQKIFLELVRDKEFVVYKTKDNSNAYRGLVDEIYYPNPELIMYFLNYKRIQNFLQ